MRDNKGHAQEIRRVKGRYANYFKVGHNAFEFVLDFGQSYVDEEDAQIHTRLVSSPNRAKIPFKSPQGMCETV